MTKAIHEHRIALVNDFQKHYNLSLYSCINGLITLREFCDLYEGLLLTPGTKIQSLEFEIDEFSINDILLINLFNAVVAGLDAKPNDKKKLFKDIKKPKDDKESRKKNRKPIYMKDKKKLVKVRKEISYHIDKQNKVRKCSKGFFFCETSKIKEHFKTKEEANVFLQEEKVKKNG